jgi:hypothetical protein
MAQRAGIALSSPAYDADFSITRVDGAPGPPIFSPPVPYKLVDIHTIKDVIDTFEGAVGFDTSLRDNGFVVSLPTATSLEQHDAVGETTENGTCSHFHAWVNACGSSISNEEDAYMLFIDLTPGQVASEGAYGYFKNQKWDYKLTFQGIESSNYIVVGDAATLSVQGVLDRLVTPLRLSSRKIDRIGIFRPGGAFSELFLEELRAKLPETLINWVTLDDLSYGAAVVMHSERMLDLANRYLRLTTSIPIGVVLADGRSVTILPGFTLLPVKRKVWFTTSRDNQTAITIQLIEGMTPCMTFKLDGLIPRPRGQARIKITLSCDSVGRAFLNIKELGSNLQRSWALENIVRQEVAIEEYELAGHKQIGIMIDRDGVIGELPE